jgi:hypothetical protein
MTTLPPPAVKYFPEDSLEKQCYNIAESLKDHLPIMNDRNRLGFNLYKYMKGEGDKPSIIVRNAKFKMVGISATDLAKKIEDGLVSIKQ